MENGLDPQADQEPQEPAPAWNASEPEDFEALHRRVSAAVRRACPSWLVEETEDVVQNVMIKLVRLHKKSDGISSFSSLYVEKTVSCALVDEIRRVFHRREGPVENGEAMERVASRGASPERDSSAREIGESILDCLERLIQPRKLAVGLYLNGCSVPQTAALLRWSHRKTESLVYRGLADMRRCLERMGLKPCASAPSPHFSHPIKNDCRDPAGSNVGIVKEKPGVHERGGS